MLIGVPKEIKPEEYRVALTPAGAEAFAQAGHRVLIEAGAGKGSGFTDDFYSAAGAEIVSAADDVRTAIAGQVGEEARVPVDTPPSRVIPEIVDNPLRRSSPLHRHSGIGSSVAMPGAPSVGVISGIRLIYFIASSAHYLANLIGAEARINAQHQRSYSCSQRSC